MLSGPDQSNESSLLNGDDESLSAQILKIFGRIDCTIRVYLLFGAWIMHSYTPQSMELVAIFISYCIKFKCYFSVITNQGSIKRAKCYTGYGTHTQFMHMRVPVNKGCWC